MTEREARIAFNMIPTVGAVRLARLMADAGGRAADAYEMLPDKRDWAGNEPAWEREIERAGKMRVRIVTEVDEDYPPLLREIASPPLALYVVGDTAALSKAGVALVGTRRATPYGQLTAERLAADLARRGWAVFSGLARGIDAAAHQGALTAGGVTVGVLGGALDRFFPEENRDLARRMVEQGGAVVSEFPFGRSPDAQTFPQRNRIVAGLARGVVAVECPVHSGTLITCSRAAEQGRAVMAVPGRIDSRASSGCLHLIREGARLVTGVDDILEELTPLGHARETPAARPGPSRSRPAGRPRVAPEAPAPEVVISADEALVLRAVHEPETSIERVVAETRLPAGRVNALLVALRLKGRVDFLPGNRIALKGR
ncbi:MAG: DNA-processing protein DprA [Kiritimatiellia bacterium]